MLVKELYVCFSKDFNSMDDELQKNIYDHFFYINYKTVFSFVRNHYSTEDIIQEAFIRVIRKPPKYVNDKQLISWIFTLTRNVTLNYIRKNRRQNQCINIDDLTTQIVDKHNITDMEVMRRCAFHTIMSKLNTLKPTYKQALYLQVIEQLTYKEIAAKLHVTEGVVRQTLYRARKEMRERLEQEWSEAIM
ncbi:RNA polymerase sigma factor [Paenibacillus apiarius]|uniref:RNA polymerase sigma factor n=1 Tax=Paenibacillus apiarius TaxID=46240 RepID=UPI003B3ABC9F